MANIKLIVAVSTIVIVAAVSVGIVLYNMDNDSDKCILVYDANGGSGNMSESKFEVGSTILISDCKYDNTKNFRIFASWNTKSDGTGTTYNPGEVITANDNNKLTLYAIWQVFTNANFGIGSELKYDISGSCTYHYYSYTYSGDFQRKMIGVGTTDQTIQNTQKLVVSYYDPSDGKNHKQENSISSSKVVDRYINYSGSSSTLHTEWGFKDIIIVHRSETDANNNTLSIVDYRDAESYVLYKSSMSCSNYRSGGITFNNWHMEYTLIDYYIVYTE